MTDDDAINAYKKLDPDVQESLKTYFGDQDYYGEKPGLLGKAWKYVRGAVDETLDTLSDYGQAITRPYRAARIAGSVDGFFSKETWKQAKDGNRIFITDLERKVDEYYAPEVSRIAKRIAMGDSFAEVLSSLTTDEDFAAFEKFANGDETFQQAIKDYDAAKISFGRDIARAFFKVGPGEFGAERKAYSFVSGTFDLAGQIIADPLTYIAAPIKAINAARFSLVKLAQLTPEARGLKVEQLFQRNDVRQFWDTTGDLIQKINAAPAKSVERTRYLTQLRSYAPELDENFISQMRTFGKEGIKDADSAEQFFKNADIVENVMRGQVGSKSLNLPRHTVTRKIKNELSTAARKLSGFEKDLEVTGREVGNFIDEVISSNTTPQSIIEAKKSRRFLDRFSRVFETALVDRRIAISGVDDLGRDLKALDAKKIYALARTVLPKTHARMIADTYAFTDEAGALKIIDGLYKTIADLSGVARTEADRVAFDDIMRPFLRQNYSEDVLVEDWMREFTGGLSDELATINPGDFNGRQLAVAEYQLARQIQLPDVRKILELGQSNKNVVARSISETMNGRVTQAITDFWSALTLLPRLGLRAVLDENLFAYATMPLGVMRYILSGEARGTSTRMRQIYRDDKSLGVVSRFFNNRILNKLSSEERLLIQNALQTDPAKAQAAIEGVLNQRRMINWASDPNYSRWAAELSRYQGTRHLEDLSTGLSAGMQGPVPKSMSVDKFGSMQNVNLNIENMLKAKNIELSGTFAQVHRSDDSFAINFLLQLNARVDRNGMIGQLAVKNMENPRIAIQEIADYFRANPETFRRFGAADRNVTEEELAFRAFTHVRNLFVSPKGELNTKLLSKVRTVDDAGKQVISAQKLNYEDIDEVSDFFPEFINGYAKQVPTFGNVPDLVQKVIDGGFSIADRQVSTLSREPVYNAYYFWYRKQMSRAEKNFKAAKVRELTQQLETNPWAEIKKLHPNMAENYKKDMALVKTSFLKKYREFDRTKPEEEWFGSRKTIDAIRKDFREGRGLNNPIYLDYYIDESNILHVYVSEGNHRLAAALEEGIEDLPVVMYRSSPSEIGRRLKPIGEATKLKPKDTPDRYIPASANPVDVLPDAALGRIKSGMPLDKAQAIADDLAARRYSALANDMAMNRMIGFVDNPLVRTNLAFSARNLARYYRATEDFYRRVYRAAKFSPESIVRLRLTSEGLDHAGFIHEDENGERYFFMPIDQIMYSTLNPIVETLTGEPMKQPMPLRLSGKIKMLTPSLDPESALPALSGPFAAVSVTALRNLIPDEFMGAKDTINRFALGPYAENQSLFDMVTPTLIKRSYEILNATLGDDELSSQAASAALKSAAFYAANGMAPGPDAEIAEREEFQRNVQSTARNIVVLRNLLGIFSPVAPQVMTSGDVPKSLLESGVVNFKSEFNNLVQVELEKGNANAYDEALRKWTKLNPGRLVYTVSETEMNKVASIAKTKQAAEWVKKNGGLLDRHPEGAGFLIPAAGEFDIDSYSFLKREGFIESKPLEKFLGEISNIDAENQYYDMKEEMETRLANVYSPADKSYLRQKFDAERKAFLDARPYLRLQLEQVGGDQVKRDALTDLRNLVNAEYAPQTATTAKIRQMIEIFDRASAVLNSVTGRTDEEIAQRDYVRNRAYNELVKLAETNPNATMVLNKIMKRLLGV